MRNLTENEVATWVQDTLLSPARTRPIVAVTSHPGTDRAWIDADDLQRALGDLAEVVFLRTGEPTWALAEAMPPRLDVYGGALRIWWPGLTRESDPYEHRLYFVHTPADAQRVFQLIVAAVHERAGQPPAIAKPPAAPATAPTSGVMRRVLPLEPPERVRITAVSTGRIEVAGAARHGPVLEADLPLGLLADAVQVGGELMARPLRPQGNGTWAFSTTGLLPNPWQRFVAEVKIGDVVLGRVQNVLAAKKLVFVDVLPGVVGVCHISELDWSLVTDMTEFAKPGQLLEFSILEIVDATMSLQLSRKRAYGQQPRPSPSLVEGGRAFVWKDGLPMFESLRHVQRRTASGDAEPAKIRIVGPRLQAAAPAAPAPADEEIEALKSELAAAIDERTNLVAQIRALRLQVQEAKKELRAASDRHAASEKRGAELDPLSSERAFLQSIRVWHARQFDEDDRLQHPLQRMRVGREFLASVRALAGIEVDKVIAVCAQVAADRAHTIGARVSHQLRAGSRGADSRTRKSDGAQGWRCALQVNSPSARRLHWWNVPGKDGAVIEFAIIGVHDSFDIPEG